MYLFVGEQAVAIIRIRLNQNSLMSFMEYPVKESHSEGKYKQLDIGFEKPWTIS
jgi:hypothetical protein